MDPLLLAFWATFAVALLAPGPNFAVILSTSLKAGRGPALRVASGFGLGEAIWGFAAVFGVATLAAHHPWIEWCLRIGGGLFLLYLGYGALKSALRPQAASEGIAPSAPATGFWRGLGLMMLNPKAGVFWVSLTGAILGPDVSLQTGSVAVTGAVIMSLLWHWSLAYILTAPLVQRLYQRGKRGLEAVLGAVLAGFGLKLLLS
ncbi:LysE family translocator [Lacibacterium aquatile]|uniref:LysE family translocator n=1 Tax=Lacibacterium aquatile TaxID=1168082 RepID=A0ABW5DYL7_9PROT